MYRSILAAALAALSFTGAAVAQPANLSVDNADICVLLEDAHESTCSEFNLLHANPSMEFTGSVAQSNPADAPVDEPVKPRRIPGLATGLTGSGDGGLNAPDGQPKDEPRPDDGGYDGSGTPGPVTR